MDVSGTFSTTFRASTSAALCDHCGAIVPAWRSSKFCCAGCEAVSALLPERNPETYDYIDAPDFLATHSRQQAEERSMYFYLEGVHCAACVASAEGIADQVPGVRSIRLDLARAIAVVQLLPGGAFAPVARRFSQLGYRPVPVRAEEVAAVNQSADRKLLLQLGVAGACAGNIMLMTTSIYAGASGAYAQLFRWVSFGLSLPVLLFSAVPFYQGAWKAIRGRQVSIDLPIALGILLGGVSSLFNLISGSEYLYFDSLTMLVFLMLASRYLLRRTQQRALGWSRLARFVSPALARVWSEPEGRYVETHVDRIRPGDRVRVRNHECLPVDGRILEGRSSIDISLLTGESGPVEASPGMLVYAGTVNIGEALIVTATASGKSTRLGQILEEVETDLARKAEISTFSDRIARGFVAAVLIAVAVVFAVGLRVGLHEATNLALALSIVTCPCAFALGTPLALSLSMGKCARAGVLVKGPDVLERLARVNEIFLDKTGTLTEGSIEVTRWVPEPGQLFSESDVAAIVALEARSSHVVARAILRFFQTAVPGPLPDITGFEERLGHGVTGTALGHRYEIFRAEGSAEESHVAVERDGHRLGLFHLADVVRSESKSAVDRLKGLGFSPRILSGDSELVSRALAERLGVSYTAALSPERKREIVSGAPRGLMVGDGANDAAALAAAYVGVAVQGGMEVSLRSAGAYFRRPGLAALPSLITVGRETMKVIHRGFAFSLVYNIVGILGVLEGRLTPLFAAVLMPISALTVLLSSLAGTRRMRRALKEMRS